MKFVIIWTFKKTEINFIETVLFTFVCDMVIDLNTSLYDFFV